MQVAFKFASNFPNKNFIFTKINVGIFAYVVIILYLCITNYIKLL